MIVETISDPKCRDCINFRATRRIIKSGDWSKNRVLSCSIDRKKPTHKSKACHDGFVSKYF